MKGLKTVYICSECEYKSPKWLGKCPKCGAWVDVFIRMGGDVGMTGTLASNETCDCGYILPAGSYETDYEA